MEINTDIIKTWGWRIKRVGLTAGEFAGLAGVTGGRLSLYQSGKVAPRPKSAAAIENKLKELEKERGFDDSRAS